jgi:hypothetical protein
VTEQQLSTLDTERGQLAAQMQDVLLGAEFYGHPVPPGRADALTAAANRLLTQADRLAGQP